MEGSNGNGTGSQEPPEHPTLIPQPHGGALMPPPVKGEVRNPWGRLTRRTELAREMCQKAGLEELFELALIVRKRKGELANALVEAACDPSHKGQIHAQRLLRDVLGQTKDGREARSKLDVQVQYVGKVRVMEGPEDAEYRVVEEPKT